MSKSLKDKASERLVEARKALGLDAQEAAVRCGIKPSTYYQYENGTRFPPLTKAIPIARKLKVSLDWWLAGIGVNTPEGAEVVPILGWVSAGDMLRDDVSQDALGSIKVAELPPWRLDSPQSRRRFNGPHFPARQRDPGKSQR